MELGAMCGFSRLHKQSILGAGIVKIQQQEKEILHLEEELKVTRSALLAALATRLEQEVRTTTHSLVESFVERSSSSVDVCSAHLCLYCVGTSGLLFLTQHSR